ncbi:F-box protein [Canna indica]|uniref:F-box protein n=1 Tax=Canna indica TaxID=4628 RepID=A0AAQ3KNM9_9LILI|nr:F-box protein [Canna indica]
MMPKRSKRTPPPPSSSSMADWSQIQEDLLLSIFSKLQIHDMVRSATVCSSWSVVVRKLFSHQLDFRHLSLRHMSPWLMFSVSGEEKSSSFASAISLSDQEVFTIPIPEPPLRDRFCIGSSHGWLIASNQQSDLQMLNPVTGVQMDLPPVTTMDRVKPIVDRQGCISGYLVLDDPYPPADYGVEDLRFFLYRKAILSSDPSLGDYTVALLHRPFQLLSFTRAGDNKWTALSIIKQGLYEDATFYQGKLYTVTIKTN